MTTPNTETLTTLLHQFAPDHSIEAMEAMNLGFSNQSFKIIASGPEATQDVYIAKYYTDEHEHVFGENAVTRARVEHETLKFLFASGLPTSEPTFIDLQGTILGSPVLVTKYLPGIQILAHPANSLWAQKAPKIAALLASIHTLSCPKELTTTLPDAMTQAAWFLKKGTIPDYMDAYPDGASVWQIVRQELPSLRSTPPVLVHGDYWSGNILWENSQVTAVLDWENVAFGEPGLDVANCRMEMIVDGMDDAADIFLNTYETITGRPVANLGLCELVVAVQPMWQRAPFLEISPYQERFRQFVASAKKQMQSD